MKKIIALSALGAVLYTSVPTVRADDAPPAKPWKETGELSVVSANGNSRSTTSSAKNTYSYKLSKTTFETQASALGAKSNGVVTAEQYLANEKVSYALSERNYTFEKFQWDKNRFAGISDRYDSSIGLGRDLINKGNDKLIGEIGGGYVNEQRTNAPRNAFTSGRAYAKYTRTLSATANFSQDAEYLHDFDDKNGYRVNTESDLIASLSVHFSLKVSYVWKYLNKPAPGFGRSDTTTAVALIANY